MRRRKRKRFPNADLTILGSGAEEAALRSACRSLGLEAAAAGLPIVALPASGGIRDMLGGRPWAWLASDISAEALTASLLSALATLRSGEGVPRS